MKKTLTKAIYPGSFDPITFGHIDIIKRIHGLFDELIVLVSNSPQKNYLFSSQERCELVRACLDTGGSFKVDVFDGLTVDYARKAQAKVIIRGIRAVADFEYEMAMANINKKLNPDIETLIVFASPEYDYVSSRMVKEVAHHGGELENLVPQQVREALEKKFPGRGL